MQVEGHHVRCKADGGSTYRYFEPQMDARMQERRSIELDLRKALVSGEFALNYQPVVNIKSGKVSACEALIRVVAFGRIMAVLIAGGFIVIALWVHFAGVRL